MDWNQTDIEYPRSSCIHELFEEQVERTPDATAVIFNGEHLTYRKLNARANQLAHFLRRIGVGPEKFVAVCIERSFDTIIAFLAVMKAGAVYIPLDANHPLFRNYDILCDTHPDVFLVKKCVDQFVNYTGLKFVLEDIQLGVEQESRNNPINLSSPDNLLSVIYTSSSTGRPKGTLITINAILNRLYWMWGTYPFRPGDVALLQKSTALIGAMWDCFGGLLKGIPTVILSSQDVQEPSELWSKLVNYRVSHLLASPAVLLTVLEQAELYPGEWRSLRLATTSAEPISPSMVTRWYKAFPQVPLLNMYGATECASNITIYDTSGMPANISRVPIGGPIWNTQVYILDNHMNLVPTGGIGEMCVTGACLTRGYLGLPGLTAKHYVPNPFSATPGARLYKTGDLARWRADGNIELIGRKDHQVKLRGFRIKLGDIEAALLRCEKIRKCAVILHEYSIDEKHIVAYIEAKENIVISELRRVLQDYVPSYMIPSDFVLLDALPLTPNGKLDRKSLPPPDRARLTHGSDSTGPRTEPERMICAILEELLKISNIDIYTHLMDLGLHSLLMLQLQNRLLRHFNKAISILKLLSCPTISSLAEYFSREQDELPSSHENQNRAEKRRMLRRQRRLHEIQQPSTEE
jgi:amino acid adenylation domain-containing protein